MQEDRIAKVDAEWAKLNKVAHVSARLVARHRELGMCKKELCLVQGRAGVIRASSPRYMHETLHAPKHEHSRPRIKLARITPAGPPGSRV
jgi:hypothetical protein